MEFVGLILIGMVVGLYAGKIIGGKGFGVIVDLIAGIVGAFLGGAFFGKLGIWGDMHLVGSFLFAATGAVGLLFAARKVRKA